MQPCPKCKKPLTIELEYDFSSASAFCVSGHRFIFLRGPFGQGWETPEQRMKRLATPHTCQHCGKTFIDYKPSLYGGMDPRTCNDCSNNMAHESKESLIMPKRSHDNGNSPWRKKTRYVA